MAVSVQPAFGPFVYAASNADVTGWSKDGAGTRRAVSSVPRSHIARATDGFLAPRVVAIDGTIGAESFATRDDYQAAVDSFFWAHRPGFRPLYRNTDRTLSAEVRDINVIDMGLLWADYHVEFEAADPYWYSTSGDTDTWAAPLTTNTRTVTNGGNADTLPVFTFTFGSTATLALTAANNTITDSFVLAGAITSGDVLVVDCAAQTVKLNGANKMSYFTGDFFRLDPGGNVLELIFTGPTISSLVTSFTKRWL